MAIPQDSPRRKQREMHNSQTFLERGLLTHSSRCCLRVRLLSWDISGADCDLPPPPLRMERQASIVSTLSLWRGPPRLCLPGKSFFTGLQSPPLQLPPRDTATSHLSQVDSEPCICESQRTLTNKVTVFSELRPGVQHRGNSEKHSLPVFPWMRFICML